MDMCSESHKTQTQTACGEMAPISFFLDFKILKLAGNLNYSMDVKMGRPFPRKAKNDNRGGII